MSTARRWTQPEKLRFIKSPQETDATEMGGITDSVTTILREVAAEGDAAVRRFSQKFDRAELEALEVTEAEIERAYAQFDPQSLADSQFAIAQVTAFAERQLETMQPLEIETLPGVHLGHRIIPIETVGCYVPGGRYPLYSAPIMSIVPAVVAGCREIVACLPPNTHETMFALCHLAGAHRIFKIGGAQAIAAMAYGTESVPAADKIVGPGNAFVNEAKRQVFGAVGIDQLAGPSEIFTIADDSGDARVIAADLLAQAEHDVHTRVGLATTSARLAEDTLAAIDAQLATLSTRDTAGEAWARQGQIVVCEDRATLIDYANFMATEHLQIHATDAHEMAREIHNYGSLFIGENASVVYSDKCCGTNHTLPTMAAARYTGGLWVGTYVKVCTHQWMETTGVETVAPKAVRQSLSEGMEGHARAAALRLYPQAHDRILDGDIPET
ncbi:histidinol dehydrogenase [Salinisphaera sp. T31B1]